GHLIRKPELASVGPAHQRQRQDTHEKADHLGAKIDECLLQPNFLGALLEKAYPILSVALGLHRRQKKSLLALEPLKNRGLRNAGRLRHFRRSGVGAAQQKHLASNLEDTPTFYNGRPTHNK